MAAVHFAALFPCRIGTGSADSLHRLRRRPGAGLHPRAWAWFSTCRCASRYKTATCVFRVKARACGASRSRPLTGRAAGFPRPAVGTRVSIKTNWRANVFPIKRSSMRTGKRCWPTGPSGIPISLCNSPPRIHPSEADQPAKLLAGRAGGRRASGLAFIGDVSGGLAWG